MIENLTDLLMYAAKGTTWESSLTGLRLFHFITVRSAGAATTALLLSWWLGPKVIAWLKRLKFGQQYRDKAESSGDLVARVLTKKGTPTMGGRSEERRVGKECR